MGAGVVEAVLAVTPMETVKTKLIQHNLGLVEGLRAILRYVLDSLINFILRTTFSYLTN